MDGTLNAVVAALSAGLPLLLFHFAIALLLLIVGVVLYMKVTPFDEWALITRGNVAGGVALAAAVMGLSLPLAATLATSAVALDIVLWGVVAILLQLVTFGIITALMRNLRSQIESGNVAVACVMAAAQFAVGLLNAAAVAG